MKSVDLVGWAASVALLAIVGWQVYTQWRSGKSAGLSRWLFVGQIAASTGFVIYSWLVENWVFVVTNAFMLVTACFGQYLFLRRQAAVQTVETTAGIKIRAMPISTTKQAM